jgi:hypothetical protein
MKIKRAIPFRNLSVKNKLNLVIAACITIYAIFVISVLASGRFCKYIGVDYCAYWTGGRLMLDKSIADVYDMDLLRLYQEKLYPQTTSIGIDFKVVPLPYLPVFVLIFPLFSTIDLPYSFIFWTLLNVLGFIFYLRFFIKDTSKTKPSYTLLAMIIISLPVFLNLFYGQVNFFLGICAGEIFRALIKSKSLKAGLWLGGWLFKPQLLILILPILLFTKRWKVLLGFFISLLFVLTISYGLIGKEGFLHLLSILVNSSQGGASSDPQVMMNWRMIGINLANYFNSNIGSGIIITGSLATTIVTFLVFLKKNPDENPDYLSIFWLGVLAATGAVTWHAHLSMSVVLIPFVLYLFLMGKIDLKIIVWWIFMPIIFFILKPVINLLIYFDMLPEMLHSLPTLWGALPGFIFNLVFLGWAVKHYHQPKLEMNSESII